MIRNNLFQILFRITFVLWCTSSLSLASPLRGSSKILCVQTFNAYGPFYASNLKNRMAAMVKTLESEEPCHSVHLQEVWLQHHKTYLQNQLSGTKFLFPTQTKKNLGLFSINQLETLHTEGVSFDVHGSLLNPFDWGRKLFNVRKGFGYTRSLWRGKIVHQYNTHLHPSSAYFQYKQLEQLGLHIAQQPPKEIVIVSGDFNLKTQDRILKNFLQRNQLTRAPTAEPTYHHDNTMHWGGGSRTIDHILYKNIKLLRTTVNLKSHQNIHLSDHFGVRAWFEEN